MTIKLYKLVSGDEVIGDEQEALYAVNRDTGERQEIVNLRITLNKPRILQVMMSNNGPQIALRPFYVGSPSHETISFTRAQVIGDAAPVQQALEDAYLQQTSGLVLNGRVS